MSKIFTQIAARPDSGRTARRIEEQGFDGISFVDSQNLSGDVYVAMATAAVATETLELSTGVTNPVTRHPAVTASAIGSVQRVAGGRVQLGIGRGDSALAHIGRSPARVVDFERYLIAVQKYLKGEEVLFEDLKFGETVSRGVDELGLAASAIASQINWLPGRLEKVDVEVAATGPKVISAAARHSDRIMFALGADHERIKWGIEIARKARKDEGLDPDEINYGAYVNIICHPNIEKARELVRGGLSTFARFSVMHGEVVGPISPENQKVMNELHERYDMTSHTRADSDQASLLSNDFVDNYSIVGPPDLCIERIQKLSDLGLDKVIFVGATLGSDQNAAAESDALIAREVVANL